MEQRAILRSRRFSYHDQRLLAIGLAILAIVSPLYIDRRLLTEEEEVDEEGIIDFSSYLPFFLLILITSIAVSGYIERGFTLDPYWIHRVGGSSTGIVIVLIVLALVLKCKGFTID